MPFPEIIKHGHRHKKSSPKVVDELNSQSARVAEKLGLDNRIEKLAEREAFITLKDHKPEFHAHPTCRLINPSKSEIGIISKRILDEINTIIIQKTQINQWKNTSSVLKWFRNLDHKENLSFICFDVLYVTSTLNHRKTSLQST